MEHELEKGGRGKKEKEREEEEEDHCGLGGRSKG